MVKCQVEGCKVKNACYGPEGGKPLTCAKHGHEKGYIDLKNMKCRYPGCLTQPAHGKKGTKKALWCNEHKEIDDVNVRIKRCQYQGCVILPIFGKIGTKKALWCNEHKGIDDVNVKNKTCQYLGCSSRANFGKINTKNVIWCAIHKGYNDIDLNHKTCRYPGCPTQPIYGKYETKEMIWCKEHKGIDDVNNKNRKCQYLNCLTLPTYGEKGTNKAVRCKTHKHIDDIDIINKNKQCQYHNCLTRAVFGKEGSKKALWCREHKEIDDVDVANKDKECQYSDCSSRSNFGIPGEKPSRCAKHKLDGMITNPRRKCKYTNCKEFAIYTFPNSKQTLAYCEEHKVEGSVNIVEHECEVCHDIHRLVINTNKCYWCYWHEKRQGVTEYRLGKQKEVRAFLHQNNIYESSYDHKLEVKCEGYSQRQFRPDFVYFVKNTIIVLEVDEEQHRDYGTRCENDNTRMLHLTQDLMLSNPETQKIVFIRYNPDKFKCPGKAPTGESRLKWLKETILTEYQPGRTEVIYLFYDTVKRCYKQSELLDDLLKPNIKEEITISESKQEIESKPIKLIINRLPRTILNIVRE